MCFERRRVEVNYNIWFACVCPRQTINQFASKQCCDKLVRSIKACPAPSPTISFWPTQLFQYVWDCERVPRWILFYWKSGVTQFSRLVTFHNRGELKLCASDKHILCWKTKELVFSSCSKLYHDLHGQLFSHELKIISCWYFLAILK